MFAAFAFPILDHVSGAADGKWNPDFMETLDNYCMAQKVKMHKSVIIRIKRLHCGMQ
jgi:hypothetical protein